MIVDYLHYKVKILGEEFIAEGNIRYSNTAILTFYDVNKNELAYVELGYMDTDKIYDLIEQSKEVSLDKCYVENFSMTAYRKSRGLEKKEHVKMKSFSAQGAYFNSRTINDFTYTEFDGEATVNFKGSHFIHGVVSFDASKFGKGGADFSYVYFNNGNVDFSETLFAEGDVDFRNSVFKDGVKDFQYADFGKGEVIFKNTDFGVGNVSFIDTNFNQGDVTFKVARFGKGKVDFHFAKFGHGNISFERVEFGKGIVDFRKVEFDDGRVNFNRAVFGKELVTFEGVQFGHGKMTFNRAVFGAGTFDFQLAEFDDAVLLFENINFVQDSVSFNNSRFRKLSLKSCHLDNYFDLRMQKCSYLDLSDTIVRDIIDLKPYSFNVDIKVLNMVGMRLLGRIYIDWESNSVTEMIESLPHATHRNKAEQFRILKQNFHDTGQYNDEDMAYVKFKRYESIADLYDETQRHRYNIFWAYPLYLFKLIVFDKAGEYATNPLRVIASMLISYVVFSFVFVIMLFSGSNGIVSGIGGNHDELSIVGRSFYHSAITFLTIGYGDFYPYGAIRWVSGIEGFVGLFLMSYFTVAFVRKVLR